MTCLNMSSTRTTTDMPKRTENKHEASILLKDLHTIKECRETLFPRQKIQIGDAMPNGQS